MAFLIAQRYLLILYLQFYLRRLFNKILLGLLNQEIINKISFWDKKKDQKQEK